MAEEPEERPTLPSIEEQAHPTQAQVDAFVAWGRAEIAEQKRQAAMAPLATRPAPKPAPKPGRLATWWADYGPILLICLLLLAAGGAVVVFVLSVK